MKKLIIFVFLSLFLLGADSVSAVSIYNDIKTSVSTGGNTVVNGESQEGGAKSSIKIYTEIDGKVVEDFEKEVEKGEEFNFQSNKSVAGTKTETEVKINMENLDNSEDDKDSIETGVQVEEKVEVSFVRKILNYVFGIFKF